MHFCFSPFVDKELDASLPWFKKGRMMKKSNLQVLFIILFAVSATVGFARDYAIYSISQEIPTGEENDIIKKNYYLNIGAEQGIQKGSVLDVYRKVSRIDPYQSKKRFIYSVKIGEIKVIHSENINSIGMLKSLRNGENDPYFEIQSFMIGDQVSVKVQD